MIHYKDTTFCASPGCKNECGRKLTDEIQQKAKDSNLLLSLSYFCGQQKYNKNYELKQGDRVSIKSSVFFGIIIDYRDDNLCLVKLDNDVDILYPKSWLVNEEL